MTFDIPEATIRQIFSKYWPGRWVVMPLRLPHFDSFPGTTYHELRFPNFGRRQTQTHVEGHTRSVGR